MALSRSHLHVKVHQNSLANPHRSPHDPEPLVEAEFLVRSHNRDLFPEGLGNDLEVEWVAVVQREIERM